VRSERLQGYGLALVAAALWATLGLFYRRLEGYGLPRLTIVFYRAAIASAVLFLVLGWRKPESLRLRRRDWPLFLAFGLLGVAAFFVVYIQAIGLTGMGVAAVLMYTAPAWVTLLSAVFLKEPLNGFKVGALLLAVGGCALVGRVYDLASVRLNLAGILAGLGAGLTYGLYTIFSKVAQRWYTAWATLAYALGLGALFLLPLQSSAHLLHAATSPASVFWLLMLGLVPTLGGGVAFNGALRRVEASSASIVATLEPAVAALLGWLVLGERMEGLQVVGAGLILVAVVVLQGEMSNVRRQTSNVKRQTSGVKHHLTPDARGD
jgi:DME family drug/metabolite transporter